MNSSPHIPSRPLSADLDDALNPLIAQLTHRAFPELAHALRAATDAIATEWEQMVRDALPATERLTLAELKDSVPQILPAMADALASADPDEIRGVLEHSPKQGISRFQHKLDVTQVMLEDRLLRGLIVKHAEAGLGRRMDASEAAALHTVVDVMLHRSVVALVGEQMVQLRTAAETELKYLAFLSHDLNNNLNSIALSHHLLRQQLAKGAEFSEALELIDRAEASIDETVAGMQRLLKHEQLRKGSGKLEAVRIELHALVTDVLQQYARQAEAKGLHLSVDVPPDAAITSNRELLRLVLQNLVGNAVKYSASGTVKISAENPHEGTAALSVSDEGPGIAPEMLGIIFDAFRRGEVHGRAGVGLGLAVASQAARLLHAELTVQSELGKGSTFRLALCPENTRVRHL